MLDEPTNDLDVETLELLECLVVDYPGTVLLVSHDRAFLNNVATHTLVFEGDGVVKEYAGGYDDWLRQRPDPAEVNPPATAKKTMPPVIKEAARSSPSRPRSLSYSEQRELEQLHQQIEHWEAEQAAIHSQMAAPGFYQQEGAAIARATQQLEDLHHRLTAAYERWESLEAQAEAAK